MKIDQSSMDVALKYMTEQTNIDDLIAEMDKRKLSSDRITAFKEIVFESLLVERLAMARHNHIKDGIRDMNLHKTQPEELFDRIAKKELIEKYFDDFLDEFLQLFGQHFCESNRLIPKLKKQLSNKKINNTKIVEYYTVLFFAFKLLDYICAQISEENEIRRKTSELGKKIEEFFVNKTTPLTTKSLIVFMESVSMFHHYEIFCVIFVDYICALYSSEISEISRYEIFSAFQKEIIVCNALILNSNRPQHSNGFIEMLNSKDKIEYLKINKYISNKVYQIKMQNAGDTILSDVGDLRKSFNKLIKHNKKLSKSQYFKICANIYDLIVNKLNSDDEIVEKHLYDIVHKYLELQIYINGEEIPVILYVMDGLHDEAQKVLKEKIKTCTDENPYLKILISQYLKSKPRHSQLANAYSDVTQKIDKYLNKYFIADHWLQKQNIGRVDLQKAGKIGILNFSNDSPRYEDIMITFAEFLQQMYPI